MEVFRVPNTVRLCFYKKDAIVFDIASEKYTVLQDPLAEAVLFCINHVVSTQNIAKDHKDAIDWLLKKGVLCILEVNDTNYRHFNLAQLESGTGVKDCIWKIDKNYLTQKPPILLALQMLFCLVKTSLILKFNGMSGLLETIQKKSDLIECSDTDLIKSFASALNKACLFFPFKVRCLTWSASLAMFALRKKLRCNLVIGVQNYPFIAHAWVESDGIIICDQQNLREELSIIFCEPFGNRS